MFTISTDRARKLVRVRLTGMLSVDDVQRFYREEADAIRAMGCRPGEHDVLVDLSECPLQLQHIVAEFQKEANAPGRARRVAMVTGESLVRLQARRVFTRDGVALFGTVAEADGWLIADKMEAPRPLRARVA